MCPHWFCMFLLTAGRDVHRLSIRPGITSLPQIYWLTLRFQSSDILGWTWSSGEIRAPIKKSYFMLASLSYPHAPRGAEAMTPVTLTDFRGLHECISAAEGRRVRVSCLVWRCSELWRSSSSLSVCGAAVVFSEPSRVLLPHG